jgi:hypothetical protein
MSHFAGLPAPAMLLRPFDSQMASPPLRRSYRAALPCAISRQIVVIGSRLLGCVGCAACACTDVATTRGEMEASGARALVLPTDVADPDQFVATAEAVEDTFEPTKSRSTRW